MVIQQKQSLFTDATEMRQTASIFGLLHLSENISCEAPFRCDYNYDVVAAFTAPQRKRRELFVVVE